MGRRDKRRPSVLAGAKTLPQAGLGPAEDVGCSGVPAKGGAFCGAGYDEPNYFSYVFKKRFGVSPSQFRK